MASVDEIDQSCRSLLSAVDGYKYGLDSVIRRTDGLVVRFKKLKTSVLALDLTDEVGQPIARAAKSLADHERALELAHAHLRDLPHEPFPIEIASRTAGFLAEAELLNVWLSEQKAPGDALHFTVTKMEGVLDDNGLSRALSTLVQEVGPKLADANEKAFNDATAFIDELIGDVAPPRA